MSHTVRKVTVLGGSGNIGTLIVSSLIEEGFDVSVVARMSSTAYYPPKATVHRSDYSSSSLMSIFRGQDAVVSSIPRTSVTVQIMIIDAAIAAGVKRFLPSEYGGDSSLPGIEKKLSFTAGKQQIGEYLMSKETEGLTWTRVFTGPFLDWMLTQDAQSLNIGMGVMGWDVAALKVTIFDSGSQEFNCTNIHQVAKAIASVLSHWDATRNQNVYVSSFRLTQNQMLDAFERLSRRKFKVTKDSSEGLVAKGAKSLAEGEWLKGYIQVMSASCYAPWGYNDFGTRAEKWNALLEMPEEDLDATLTWVLEEKKLI